MKINRIRSGLYTAAKLLGDVQAVQKAGRKESAKPIADRAARRIVGKATGRLLGSLFRGR